MQAWVSFPKEARHSRKGQLLSPDRSARRMAELLRALPRARSRPKPHAHPEAQQEAKPAVLTGEPSPEMYPVGHRGKQGGES